MYLLLCLLLYLLPLWAVVLNVKDTIIDGIKEGVTKYATEAITEALPGMLDGAMPEMPTQTGGALPLPLP